ncbi:hypothetical protein [Mycobacterium phage WXIN]|nr:hypothetical protein [Mycobacterium phage WXIN]
MTDPAIEASRRAFGALWPDQGDFEFNFPSGQRQWADTSAREALRPIRELVECWEEYGDEPDLDDLKGLIYATEELA